MSEQSKATKIRSQQKGFAHIGIILAVTIVVVVIGFVVREVYSNNEVKPGTTASQPSSKDVEERKSENLSETDSPKVPADYVVYENKDVGFKLAYPKEWGTIVRTGDDRPDIITDGLKGHVLRTMFKDGDVHMLPRGNFLSGDTRPGTDEGHYGGGFIERESKYFSIAKYTNDEIEIPSERIIAKVQSKLGTVLVVNAGTIAGNRLQLLLNLPEGKSLSGLDLVLRNGNEDFADESAINDEGLETLKTVARTFEAI